MEFLTWFYSNGVEYYITSWRSTISWIFHFFSLSLLLKTLFAPWKRLVVADTSPGFNLQKKFEAFTFNLISVVIGAIVRFTLFWVGLFIIGLVVFGGAAGLLFWLILPFFGLPVYKKFKNQPSNFMQSLLFSVKAVKEAPLTVIFSSEPGQFVLTHTGLLHDELVKNADLKNINFDSLTSNTFKELMQKLLGAKVWSEEFFNQLGIEANDILLSADLWDKKQADETKLEEEPLGRPGLGLELTFGYTPTLNQYVTDLSLPLPYSHRLIGRQEIVSRMERVLQSGSSVLLIGQPGVGKKTVVLEFARRAAGGELGRDMSFKRVLEFDYNSLLSSGMDVNQKKTKLTEILAEASAAGNIILMVRDIHRLTNMQLEGYDYTDIIESHLEKRKLKIIAVSSSTDYERFLAQNLRLRKYLEKVEVTPPSLEEAMQILLEAAKRWEILTSVIITIPTLRHILEESDRYVTEVPFPEKALEFLDGVVAYCQQAGKKIALIDDANKVLEERTGISFARLTQEEKKRLGEIESIIHQRLIDQDSAVNLIGKALRSKSIGVVKEDRPLGSFLFLGPTGVGKTETAKVLAKVYYGNEENILRFDMAEYSGGEGLERLIGSVSKNLPGALTTAIKNKPASLLLLDEIEKASREIYNLFLALLDEGVITDAFGKKIIARNLFVIGTSNAGAEYIRNLISQGIKGDELQKKVVNNVLEKEIFSPEFLNRFDGVIVYEPLGHDELVKIAQILLAELTENLKKKNIFLQASDETAVKVAQDGYEPEFGARPMKRIINLILGDLIGKALLSGAIKEGDKIKITPGQKKEEFFLEKLVSSERDVPL
ncbi:MAG: hypothetical protein US60_C0005G0011 [Microgenomates group bacterium GW2011_GWC1_37_8]|uniref:Clp protease ATP binding subunit n=1 Tax=Candidatus Woesebacteria bacterium GW2011_GWB1_38_8 TaxID=1618570 RepID=A0A0G0LED3_9BACT|nr:MAG: hypothetical protein US60_C0005G0011 [Microgenomates group bacterium GW2011_GWC1_37_8]KKQ86290.1 MAG: clp protease ATP binding subunit [Candidatus Woesebacteria bacterium GW2011_GWB1_38_8]